MNAIIWILSLLLAATYAVTGASKMLASRQRLLAVPGMGWVDAAPMPYVRLIGMLELAGAIGVVVPWASGILPFLTPLAAWGWPWCRWARSGRMSAAESASTCG